MITVTIKQGECLASLAKQHGFHDPTVIFDHPANQVLKENRPNMHVLQVGDIVCIPDKTPKSMPLGNTSTLSFTIKGQVTEFKTLIEDSKRHALSHMPYELSVGTQKLFGTTDDKGYLSEQIDAGATSGSLIVYLDSIQRNTLTWMLEFGALPPHESAIGIQARLNNLGYFCANESGSLDETSKQAISDFKAAHGLNPNSVVDDAFLSALHQAYGF